MIRKAAAPDIDAVEKIYDELHQAEEEGTTTIGWLRGIYPVRATAEAALDRGDLFLRRQPLIAGICLSSKRTGRSSGPGSSTASRSMSMRVRPGSTRCRRTRSASCIPLSSLPALNEGDSEGSLPVFTRPMPRKPGAASCGSTRTRGTCRPGPCTKVSDTGRSMSFRRCSTGSPASTWCCWKNGSADPAAPHSRSRLMEVPCRATL